MLPLATGWVLLGWIGLALGSLSTLRQVDLKKIVAYSSIVHMGLLPFVLFSQVDASITGAMLMMLAHGLVSPALFIMVGQLLLATGLAGLPPFIGFIGKATVFLVTAAQHSSVLCAAVFGSVLSVVYCLFIVLLAAFGDAGATLYRLPWSPRHHALVTGAPSSVMLTDAIALFWKALGCLFIVHPLASITDATRNPLASITDATRNPLASITDAKPTAMATR